MEKSFEASFAGCSCNEIYIRVSNEVNELKNVRLCVINSENKLTELTCDYEKKDSLLFHFPITQLEKIVSKSVVFCIEQGTGEAAIIYSLKNNSVAVSNIFTDEIYDRRTLFGRPIDSNISNKVFLPYYKLDGTLSIDFVNKEDIYSKQLRNEIVLKKEADNKAYLFVKCKKIDGNYVGIYSKSTSDINDTLEYDSIEEDEKYIYMTFSVNLEDVDNEYELVWKHSGILYHAPLIQAENYKAVEINDAEFTDDKKLKITAEWEKCAGNFSSVSAVVYDERLCFKECIQLDCEPDIIDNDDDTVTGVFYINTQKNLISVEQWKLLLNLENNQKKEALPFVVRSNRDRLSSSLFGMKIYDADDTRTHIVVDCDKDQLIIDRRFSRNALNKKNIQNCSAFIPKGEEYTLDEFLSEDVGPTGRMYARFVQENDGSVWIEPCQKMGDVKEARLVMFHTQGLGIIATQQLEVCDGWVKKFKLEAPDIYKSGKILKPVKSIWVRIALAIRTSKGIYLTQLKQFDLDTTSEDGPIYDIRRLYCNSVGEQFICGIRMVAIPYYGGNQTLSLKFVRPGEEYRSQFTNELLDVRIKNDILIVKMRCRDCGGEYKGVLLEYRKEKEDDAETYLIPYKTFVKEKDSYVMTTEINLKEYYLRMLYWDIRCAFEKDGKIYTVSCHSNNKKFLSKYRGVFVDRTYPNDNSILFPYATANSSVALMHRETCPQDHWNFRLKERIAIKIYNLFKNYWDNRNIYLVFEKYCVMAQDNGYFFFKYCMDSNVEKTFPGEMYYVLDPHASDWNKLKPYRKNVVKYLSIRHMIYLLASHLLISTDTKGHAYVWRSMGSEIKAATYKKKLVFLQHGVTAFKRGHFERGTNVGCEYFITTSQFEHDIIHNYLGYPEDEVPITGFARWDVLHDKSEGHREILMMPTWRTWLDDAENDIFAESDYCKNYMALLNNPKLDEILKEYDVTLNFYLHPKFRKFITEFSVVSDNIRLIPFGEEPLNELMMQCNLLITDFSSVAWDVYYMKKPVLFYHFDIEDASKTLGFYMDMKNDLFGERAVNPDELMELIVEYIHNGFTMKEKYKKQHGKYFAYVDDNNSERIWNAIQRKQW